jgi:hypothetical protein
VRVVAVAVAVVALGGCGGSAATVDDAVRDSSGSIVETGRVGTQALRVGDCFLDPDDAAVLTVTGVACTLPHDAQMIARLVVAEAEDWPGPEALGTEAGTRCADEAASLAPDRVPPGTGLSAYVPDERSWQSGDRDIICFVEATGEERLDGDVYS